MGLARNPLLLTIIAYLYTDTPFVLPHSRTAFYDKSLAVLLEQWDAARGTPNHYTVDEKRLVLQHLALFFQDNAALGGRDRRSVDVATVLREISKVLPELSRKAEDARPLLEEIVARSGLLLAVDGGLRYQFAHLTLQEFFTAQKLQSDADGLQARFRADPDAWRETVKLWCSLPHDGTSLIRALFAEHPILAFECLGDAQQIEEGLAQEIIRTFQARLGEEGTTGEAVTRAFAAVATNPQQRGQQVFGFLAQTVGDSSAPPARRQAAAQALAWSNLPPAVEILARCASTYPAARPLLAQMGDLAMPVLVEQAKQGLEWAFDALQTVGTPQAAAALVAFLWEEDQKPHWAAWRLAALLDSPIIADTVRTYPLTEAQRKAKFLEWIWEPFEPDPASPLRVIAGRAAYLLAESAPPAGFDAQAVSPRFLLALCTVSAASAGRIKELDEKSRKELAEQLLSQPKSAILDAVEELKVFSSPRQHPAAAPPGAVDAAMQQAYVDGAREQASADEGWQRLFDALPLTLQLAWLQRREQGARLPDVNDWRNLFRPSEYDFSRSWHRWALIAVFVLLLTLTWIHLEQTIVNALQLWPWPNGLTVVLTLALAGFAVQFTRKHKLFEDADGFERLLFLLGFALGPAAGALVCNLTGDWSLGALVGTLAGALVIALVGASVGVDKDVGALLVIPLVIASVGALVGALVVALVVALVGALVGVHVDILDSGLVGALIVAVVYGSSALVYGLGGYWWLVPFWWLWCLVAVGLYVHAKRRERAAANPLHGLLDGFSTAPNTPQQ
jgi:hypothetical protein